MKTKITLFFLCCIVSFSIFAQENKIKDRRTNPDLYFLEESEVPNSLKLLPPPPEAGSILSYTTRNVTTGERCKGTLQGETKLYKSACKR